ncbi:hypothetical protein CJ202_02310 [Corynebacterium parakroppenstedtii]|nr:hypothetical protein HMPREF1861_00734 [Corynebacterium kroppenstedtii]PMC66977.1 hypothetical protein CJ202_02310 [Corynebacterium kroppenstedtii]
MATVVRGDVDMDAALRRRCYASTLLRDVLSERFGTPRRYSDRCRTDHHVMTSKSRQLFSLHAENTNYVLDHIHRVNMIYLYVRD